GSFMSSQRSSGTLGLAASSAQLRAGLAATAAAQGVDLRIVELDDDSRLTQLAAGRLDAVLTGVPGGYRLVGRDAVDSRLRSVVTTAVVREMLAAAGVNAVSEPVAV